MEKCELSVLSQIRQEFVNRSEEHLNKRMATERYGSDIKGLAISVVIPGLHNYIAENCCFNSL